MNRNFVIAIIVFLICANNSLAQNSPIFEKLDVSNGLSNNRITSIIKDQNGFVWIGTINGLNRYDGLESKVYNKSNSDISSNDISALYLDSKKRLWVGTRGGGLNLYNSTLNNFEDFKSSQDSKSITSNQVNVVYEDLEGGIWIGTEQGLSCFNEDENSFTNFKSNSKLNSLNHGSVTGISQIDKSTLWIGTFGGGLHKFDVESRSFRTIQSSEEYFTSFIYTVFTLDGDNLLLGTSAGLFRYNISGDSFSNYLKELGVKKEVNIVRAISRGQDDALWIGTDGIGLFKIDKDAEGDQKIEHFLYNAQLRSSLSGNAIYAIMEDKNANLWIGTGWNGVNVLKNNQDYEFLFSDIKGGNPYPVLSLYKNGDKLFMGLDGNGLTIFNEKTSGLTYYNENAKNHIGGDYIQCIVENVNNEGLWIGTFANGLLSFKPEQGTYQKFTHNQEDPNSLSYNDVRDIIPEDNGDLWIATWGGGLNYFNNKTKKFSKVGARGSHSSSLQSENIVALQKGDNKLWIATYGGGLQVYDLINGQIEHFSHSDGNKNSISSNNLFSLLMDSTGLLWIGTSGEGINTYNPKSKKFNRFSNEGRLRFANITGILEDNDQNIWFSTKQGIWQYLRENDEFRKIPGLLEEFRINSAYKDKDGNLYFGGMKGVVKFDPKKVVFESSAPRVVLTNFKLFNKEVPVVDAEILHKDISVAESVTLNYNADVITFEFAALNFPFSDNYEYAIKMENFDANWRDIGKDRTATYTNLAPGDYTFKVKSKEISGDWEETYTSIDVTILKPFWQRWWAIIIYLIIIVALFYIFRRYIIAWEKMKSSLKLEKFKHEKDRELYNLKQQFFTNISHEIRTPVTMILGATNRIIENGALTKSEQIYPVNTIQKHGSHLLHLVDELLDFKNLELESVKIKVTRLDFKGFCEEIFLSFKESAQHKNINFSREAPEDEVEVWFDPNQMEKVLYNLFSNALKFTPEGGSITMRIIDKQDTVLLQLSDTGIGIKRNQSDKIFNRFYQTNRSRKFNKSGFGLGLAISKEIVDLHRGELYADDSQDVGATFVLKMFKGREHFKNEQVIFYTSENMQYYDDLAIEVNDSKVTPVDLSSLRGMTILIVEDNSDVRDYIAGLLKAFCEVIEAKDGEAALRTVTDRHPDLVITDIMMPVMDGIKLTRLIKTNPETSHIPVIMLTARVTPIQQLQGYETGADSYITKPFSEKLLKLRVKNLIESRKSLKDKFKSEASILPSDLAINSLDEIFLENLIKIIRDNINTEALNAEFISKEIGMSHSVIYKKVKSLTGMTLVEFIREFKLKIAKELITEKGFSVTEACYKIGYSDRKYFSKLFKKKFGKNPSEMR